MNPELKAELDALAATFKAEQSKSLETRDTALLERISKIVEEKLKTASRNEAREKARLLIPGLSGDSPEVKNFNFGGLLRSLYTKDYRGLETEVEMCRYTAEQLGRDMTLAVQRDLTASSDPGAGFLVPPQVMSALFIPLLQAQSAIMQLGATMLDNLSGAPILIPKMTAATTPAGQAETTTVTQSEPTFGQLELNPKLLAVRSVLSNRLLAQSSPAAQGIVQRQLVRDISLKWDNLAITGSGGLDPVGLTNEIGINTTTSFGDPAAATAYAKFIEMISKVDTSNALEGNLKWLMHPNVLRQIRQMQNPTGIDLERRLLTALTPGQGAPGFLEYPYVKTTNVPNTTIAFGDWSQLVVGRWGTMFVSVDPLTVLGKLETQILVAMEYDIAVWQPTAFTIATGVTGTT